MIKKELKKMDDKTFNRLLGIVRKNATKRPQNQKEKVEFFCSKIKDRSYEFE
jgi:hypothetical protein